MLKKTIVITGASDGIGAAAARKLVADGHEVVLVGRSPQKTEAVAAELDAACFLGDFTDFGDVRELAAKLKAAYPRIDVLVNNAGGVFGDRARTIDGFEKTLQVNHLSPFLLTHLLMDTLTASGASVVNTSSAAARLFARLDIDDLNHDRNFSPNRAYGNAKLANILFARELNVRYGAEGLAAVAFHPGIVSTNFASDTTSPLRWAYRSRLVRSLLRMITPEEGAEQIVWLAEGRPGVDWVPGAYYEKKRVTKTNRQADDAALAARLWKRSAEMVGLA